MVAIGNRSSLGLGDGGIQLMWSRTSVGTIDASGADSPKRPRRSRHRRLPGWSQGSGKVPRILSAIAAVSFALLWFAFARPQALGGPITYIGVSGTSMLPTLRTGDLVVVRKSESYGIGDVVVYTIPEGETAAGEHVIHRIVGGDAVDGFVMKGDNNTEIDRLKPTPDQIIGGETMRLPYVASLLRYLRRPWVLGLVIGVLTFLIMIGAEHDEKRKRLSIPIDDEGQTAETTTSGVL